eukprot:845883_1
MSLDEVQLEFKENIGHKPHSVQQMLAYCQQNNIHHSYKSITKWWPTRQNLDQFIQLQDQNNSEHWQCIFCDNLNAHATDPTVCCECQKANTTVVNINHICLCGREVTEYQYPFAKCYSCCKVTEIKEKGYYRCCSIDCTYRKMNGCSFMVCKACYKNNRSKIDYTHTGHSFLFLKVVSMIELQIRTKKQMTSTKTWIYPILYGNCISHIPHQKERKEIEDMFNVFYDDVMKEIKQSIDSNELGLSTNILVNKKNIPRHKWLKMNKISLQWQMLGDEQKALCCNDLCCNDITQCPVRKRIQFVMCCYKEHFLELDGHGMYIEIFENALERYTATDLLNDYLHIVSDHMHDKDLKDCENNDCAELWREEREADRRGKRNVVSSNYFRSIDSLQKTILEISMDIHSFLNHRIHKQQKQNIHDEYKTPKINKFVNEISFECEEEEPYTQADSDRPKILIGDRLVQTLRKKGISIDQCNHVMDGLQKNEYDSDAVIADLSNDTDRCNHYKQSQIYQMNNNKYVVKVLKKYFGVQPNDDDKVATFVLGRYEAMYWRYFKNHRNYADKPKYKSLK